ncbi:MAG: HhoA/HhoB/HtrA family serine endopeptidase [Cyanobacteria bacterium J06639_1]
MKRKAQQTLMALALVGSGVGGGLWLSAFSNADAIAQTVPEVNIPEVNILEVSAPAAVVAQAVPSGPSSFVADVAEQVGPAVVRIDTQRRVAARSGQTPSNDPRRFFGGDREFRQRGSGSGFIISADGKIITNAHVVDGATAVTVTLQDGRTFSGTVRGADPVTDIAVIDVEANGLPTVELGDSTAVRPGDWAIAIGNPLGLNNTVTAGIVSAVDRSSSSAGVPDKRVAFIQTDTAINPGNSGGPLLDASGRAIGVNTAIIRGAQGVGFAVPIDTAQRIALELDANGRVEHAYLGIQMIGLTPDIQQRINDDPNSGIVARSDRGILIRRVVPDSPADRAGLRAGDIITSIGGQAVDTADQVQQQVFQTSVGTTLDLEIDRNGRRESLQVRTGNFPNA